MSSTSTEHNNTQLEDLSKDELISLINNLQEEKAERIAFTHSVASRVGRWTYWMFAGPGLYKATTKAWGQWFGWLRSPSKKPWPEEASGEFVASVLSRMMKIGIFSILMVIAFPALQLVILIKQNELFEQQNARIDRQNSLLAFEQTTKFKEQFSQDPINSTGNTVYDFRAHPDSAYMWPEPNMSVVIQIVNLANREEDIVIQGLYPLLEDEASGVAISALVALNFIVDSLIVEDMQIDRVNLSKIGFSHLTMSHSRISDSRLLGMGFTFSDLSFSRIAYSQLDKSRFFHSDLVAVTFHHTSLRFVDFSNTNLKNTSWRGSDLSFANFTDAQNLNQADLCDATSLHGIRPGTLHDEIEELCPEKLEWVRYPVVFESGRAVW